MACGLEVEGLSAASRGGDGTTPTSTPGDDGSGVDDEGDASTGTSDGQTGDGGTTQPLRYNEIVQKVAGGAQRRDEPIFDQLLYHRVRALELQLRGRGDNGDFEADGGNSTSGCRSLRSCLSALRAFQTVVPEHEVITLYLDVRDGFGESRTIDAIDRALNESLAGKLVTPAELRAACPAAGSVRDTVSGTCAWPTLEALRGRVIAVVVGGEACEARGTVARYTEGGAKMFDRAAFVAPDVTDNCPWNASAVPAAAFFSMRSRNRANVALARQAGLVARITSDDRGPLDDEAGFVSGRNERAHAVTTTRVNDRQYPWSRIRNEAGFPFACASGSACDGQRENGRALTVRATTGDLWDSQDSFFFAYATGGEAETWTSAIGVPSSHVDEFAKACVMARASNDARSAYVAVCRLADRHPLRLQFRTRDGEWTQSQDIAFDAPARDRIGHEGAPFVSLRIEPAGSGSVVTVAGSYDGTAWKALDARTIERPLPLRGVAVATRRATRLDVVFADLTRQREQAEAIEAGQLRGEAIGTGAQGGLTDGVRLPF
jgi:hypothetical protein